MTEGPTPPRIHPVFDIEKAKSERPLDSFSDKSGPRRFGTSKPDDPIDLWKPRGRTLSGSASAACIEQVRADTASRRDLGEAVPVDVFLWEAGEPPLPYLTKTGGVPHRERSKPWPLNEDGDPCTFVAQWCFVDSRDIAAEPRGGEVLLLFFKDDYGLDAESLVLEWADIELAEPTRAEDVPPPLFEVPVQRGVVWRTAEYPEAREAFDLEGHYQAWFFAVTQSTKIGKETCFIQGDPRDWADFELDGDEEDGDEEDEDEEDEDEEDEDEEDEDDPLPDGDYEIEVRIWDHATAAEPTNLVWGRRFVRGEFDPNVLIEAILDGEEGLPLEGAPKAVRTGDFSEALSGTEDRFVGWTVRRVPEGPVPCPREFAPRQQIPFDDEAEAAESEREPERKTPEIEQAGPEEAERGPDWKEPKPGPNSNCELLCTLNHFEGVELGDAGCIYVFVDPEGELFASADCY